MKRMVIIIITIVSLLIITLAVYIKFDINTMTYDEIVKLGEEKYLKFLWMVDGAFNDARLKEELLVNGKKLSEEDKVFTCEYENKTECVGNNFESEFKKLFKSSINYMKVYSDSKVYSWLSIKNDKYIFNNLNTCNISRMGINHELKVKMIYYDKIIYEVSFSNRRTNQTTERNFILILEDNEWKIDTAYYHDLCDMNYTIS